MRIYFLLILLVLGGCSHVEKDTSDFGVLQIIEDSPNRWTAITKQNLHHLTQVYHLKSYFFEKRIHLQLKTKSHFQNKLVLETRYAEFPHYLLSQFLHQEFHFWLRSKKIVMDQAIKDLSKIYPRAPKEFGEKNNNTTYIHLMICYLEYAAIIHLLGEKESKKIFSHFVRVEKNYSWAYQKALTQNFGIKKIIHKYRLFPPPLS